MTPASAVRAPRGTAPSAAPLLSLTEVCTRLGLQRAAVRRLMRTQGLRYTRIGNKLRFRPEWIEDFIDGTAVAAPRGRR